jgi:uncharacterized membrane protein YkoI
MLRSLALTVCVCIVAVTVSAQTPMPQKTAAKAHKDTPASLRKEARISEKTARATALKEVPNGHVTAFEIERENGKLIWSYDIKLAGKSGIEEITVDALTGAVLTHEHETPSTEKKVTATKK